MLLVAANYGKVPKTFHEGPHNTKWWLLELIPIEGSEEK
jgi:hypothetical protein